MGLAMWRLYEAVPARGSLGKLLEREVDLPACLLHKWPAVITATQTLIKVILNKQYESVGGNLANLGKALRDFLQPAYSSILESPVANPSSVALCNQTLCIALAQWRETDVPDKEALKTVINTGTRNFLTSLEHLFLAGVRAGKTTSAEANRRIKFFVDSMFMVKPATRPPDEMPCFSTLTPYYNEDVILSMESLVEQTTEGVTTLEYLQVRGSPDPHA